MRYIALYIDDDLGGMNRFCLIKSFKKEENAYYCLGKYIFNDDYTIFLNSLYDDLDEHEFEIYSMCVKNIDKFDQRYKKGMNYDSFKNEFYEDFSKSIPIIEEAINKYSYDGHNIGVIQEISVL